MDYNWKGVSVEQLCSWSLASALAAAGSILNTQHTFITYIDGAFTLHCLSAVPSRREMMSPRRWSWHFLLLSVSSVQANQSHMSAYRRRFCSRGRETARRCPGPQHSPRWWAQTQSGYPSSLSGSFHPSLLVHQERHHSIKKTDHKIS